MNNHENSIGRNLTCYTYQTTPLARGVVRKSAINVCNELVFSHPTIHFNETNAGSDRRQMGRSAPGRPITDGRYGSVY
jgi:hypothetical protein